MESLKIELAAQMVIMDAIEKGHTNAAELAAYMKSKTFKAALKSYLNHLNTL